MGRARAVGVDFRVRQRRFHFRLLGQQRLQPFFQPTVLFLLRLHALIERIALFGLLAFQPLQLIPVQSLARQRAFGFGGSLVLAEAGRQRRATRRIVLGETFLIDGDAVLVHRPRFISHFREQVTVVSHHKQRAVKGIQGFDQRFTAFQIKMVGGLVKNQKIRPGQKK